MTREHIINISYLVSARGAPGHHGYPGQSRATALLHQNHLPLSASLQVDNCEQWRLFLSGLVTCCIEESCPGNNQRERLEVRRPVALFAGKAC